MSLSSEHDARGFIRLTLDGEWPTTGEILRLHDSLGDITAVRRLLIDISRATGPLPKFTGIRDVVTSFDTNAPAAQTRKRAVIVASDVQFGVARTFQAIVPGQMEVFRSEADALAWLLA